MHIRRIVIIVKRFLLHKVVIRILDYLIPKSDDIWIFGSNGCKYFYGNSMFLFDYLIRNNHARDIYWVTRDSATKAKISSIYGSNAVISPLTIKGIILILKSKVVFISHHKGDVFYHTINNRKRLIIQLWHGIMMKRMGLTDKSLSNKQKKHLADSEFSKYSYITVSSIIEQDTISLDFGLPLDNILVTGYPRNDYLVDNNKFSELLNCYNSTLTELINEIQKYSKVLLYAPTLRQYNQHIYNFTRTELINLNNYLQNVNAILFLRTHAENSIQANAAINPATIEHIDVDYSNIRQLNHDTLLDSQFILPHIDILITDYSGIYYDYLLLDRPVIFLPCDYEEYERTRGFVYDYDIITAGPKVTNAHELIEWIDKYINDPSTDRNLREHIQTWFHKYNDGRACERIIQLVESQLSV